jgi:hypothetical protein
MVDRKQLTVAWHVDDLKISHVSAKVVDNLITDLDSKFGKETPLSKSRGKVHDYLGMTLDFSVPGQVTLTMIDYIKMICMDLPKDMVGKAATPQPPIICSKLMMRMQPPLTRIVRTCSFI